MGAEPGPPAAGAADYSRKWYVMASIAMAVFLATIDGSIVNIALPTFVEEFDASFSLVQWVVLAYLLTWATLSVSVGRIGDMVGKKKIYTIGFGVFTGASVLAGLSPNIGVLIGWRVVQAVGAAMILSLGVAIVTEAFPSTERGKALGIIGAMVSVGIVTGPTLGGLILQDLSWRWIFFVNLPVGILGTIMAMRFVPDTPPPGEQRFDYLGAGLFLVSLLAILLALSLGQEQGFTQPHLIVMLVSGLALLVLFVLAERRVEDPMVDLSMFRNVDFAIGLATGFLSFVAIRAVTTAGPFFLTDTLGFEVRQVGLILAASPIALGVIAPFSGRAADRFGPRPVTVIGLVVLVIAYGLTQFVGVETTGLQFALLVAPIGLGMGIFQSPNNSAIMGSVSPDQLGVAGGMLGLNRLMGQIVGFAVLVTYWAAQVDDVVPGQSVAETEAAAFRSTTVLSAAFAAVALGLALWALRRWFRARPVAVSPAPGTAVPPADHG